MSVVQAPETTLCKYMRAVDALKAHPDFDGEDALLVETWLNGDQPAEHIGLSLRTTGYPVSNTTIKEHRRNVCACSVAS
jgi:hypothetical protein